MGFQEYIRLLICLSEMDRLTNFETNIMIELVFDRRGIVREENFAMNKVIELVTMMIEKILDLMGRKRLVDYWQDLFLMMERFFVGRIFLNSNQ